MTKLMLEGNKDESDDKENRKGNRRETWAPGLAGTHVPPQSITMLHALLSVLYASCCALTELILHVVGVMHCSA